METCRGTQDEIGDGSGDGNESSSGDFNWDKDERGDGNGDGIRDGGGEANKRMKPLKTCRRDQSFLFHTRHDRCGLRVALAGTRELRSQPPGSIHAHRTEGVTGRKVGEETNVFRVGIRVGDM